MTRINIETMNEVIQELEQASEQGWDIYEALGESTTDLEARPPAGAPYDQSCVPLSVTTSDSLFGVIRHIESEMGLSSKSQSAQRCHRYGLQEIQESDDPELKEALQKIGAYRDVIRKYVPELGEAKLGFGALRETQPLPVNFGWDTKNRADSYSIYWNQKEIIRVLTDHLRVSESDIFQWSMIEVTIELGNEGLIDEDEAKRAEKTRRDIIEAIKHRLRFTKAVAKLGINEAHGLDSHDRVANYCSRKVPDLWEEYERRVHEKNQAFEENDPSYGNPFLYPDAE